MVETLPTFEMVLSAMIRDIIKEGKIVSSEITVNLLRKAIYSSWNDKVLIDGFPRSEENRISFEKIVSFLLFGHKYS